MLFADTKGETQVFNAAFIKSLTILDTDPLKDKEIKLDPTWPYGFGIWLEKDHHDVEIRILPPASRFFARQIWDSEEEAPLFEEGEVLVKRFKSALSPQLVAKILSVGRFVKDVHPPKLKEMVLEEARSMAQRLK